ncbi:conjugal transfer protein TraG N-terminal domain-containing protein [Vibrio parahaemolyticus]|nr:conjugal transfer protein TraG N-terminal domain-containing protein [Vibrio parahaemolyticus]
MLTLEYYTYTQGATLQRALNAIAAFFSSTSFASLLSISLMLGAVATLLYYSITRDTKHIYTWAAVFVLVPAMLIHQKARMQIIDLTESHRIYAVDNVPYIVAIPTWAFSTMMVGITEPIEALFTTVDNERYGRTGMMFGSELYRLSRYGDIKESELRKQWNDFFRNCLIGDVEINGKYSWDELTKAPDMFAFLDSKPMSPLRGVMLTGNNFKTCAEFYPTLRQSFTAAAERDLNLLGTYLYGQDAAINSTHLRNALTDSYSKFVGVSNNAVDILRQNMAINAFRNSIDTTNETATGLNYAYTANKMQQTSMWASLGLQAREFIPMMHTMMFFLFSCLGFFVAAVAVIPSMTKLVLVNYIKTFAYLATWPTLFAILNAIMLWTLESHSEAISNPYNGLSLANSNPLDELHTRFAYMTGILMMSIPLLAGKILQGGAEAIQSMNYSIAGMINSTNARVSAASSSGSIDFGNLQMQNHSFNNTSANKFDDNLLMRTGIDSIQQRDGSMVNTFRNDGGRHTYNAQETESKPLWSASVNSTIQNSINDQYSSAVAAQTQASNNLSDAYSTNAQISNRWNDSWSKNQSYGDGHSISTEGQISQANTKMQSAIDNVSQTMGWTHDQARSFVTAANISGGLKLPGALGEVIGVTGGVESRWSDEERRAYSNMTAEQRQAMQQASEQYNEGATAMERAGRTVDTKEQRSDIEQYAHDFAINHQRMQGLTANVSEANSRVDNLSHMKSRMESDSSSFVSSAISGFQSYLENERNMDQHQVRGLMTARMPEDINQAKTYFDEYTQSDSFMHNFGVDTSKSGIEDLANLYQPHDLGSAPSMSNDQKTLIEQGTTTSQNKVEEVTTDMIRYKGSDNLYDGSTYHNVKGNALVYGGYAQMEATEQPSMNNNTQGDVQNIVADNLAHNGKPENAGSPQPKDGYSYVTQNPNKNG